MAKSTNNTSDHPLRVFEAFAGIGAQNVALKRAKINYEIVGISEWFVNALKVYDAINCSNCKTKIYVPSQDKVIEYLSQYTFSRDSTTPIKDITRMSASEQQKLYKANKETNNYGSITDIKGHDLPDIDLLIYSFPCQDLSTGGKTLGMSKDSGTRSGLLWEIERILKELKKEKRLPEYLLLENVKAIYAPSNAKDLNQWLEFLESLGYKNGTKLILDATNFGIPQNRKRAFIISHLGEKIDDSSLAEIYKPLPPISNFLKTDYDVLAYRIEANEAQLKATPSREEMWAINKRDVSNCTTVNTITCNMDRSNTAAMFRYCGPELESYRLLTIREAFLLMGFSESDYIHAKSTGLSYRQLNKLIGNSIVVDVLVEIFKLLFGEKYGKERKHEQN